NPVGKPRYYLLQVPHICCGLQILVDANVAHLTVEPRNRRRRGVLPVRHPRNSLDPVYDPRQYPGSLSCVRFRFLVLVKQDRLAVFIQINSTGLARRLGGFGIDHGERCIEVPANRIRASGARGSLALLSGESSGRPCHATTASLWPCWV